MKCLIVDDDVLCRTILKDILSEYFNCELATNGAEAVDLFSQSLVCNELYDLICMDITMPLCDGYEAISKIRNIENTYGISTANRVKIIMISSINDAKMVVDSYCKGVNSYIVKPADSRKLIQILKSIRLID